MKKGLKWGLIGGLTLGVIGLISALTINHALEPSHLLLRPFALNKISLFSPYSFCESDGTMTCVWTIVRVYAIILEFIIGFILGSIISLFVRKSNNTN